MNLTEDLILDWAVTEDEIGNLLTLFLKGEAAEIVTKQIQFQAGAYSKPHLDYKFNLPLGDRYFVGAFIEGFDYVGFDLKLKVEIRFGRWEQIDRFVSPCESPEGKTRELLEIMIEECAEIQQRVTKALRFGLEEVQPGQDLSNASRIALEVGDLLEVLDRVIQDGIINDTDIENGRVNKAKQLKKFMQNR